jgi:hypothetical protein
MKLHLPFKLLGIAFLLTGFFAGQGTALQAQISQTIYFMDKLPQSAIVNPAYQHSHNFHLGLPGISSVGANARINFASYNDLVFRHPRNNTLISFLHPDANLSDFTSKLRESNYISPDLHINLISFGFRARRSFIRFNISERVSGRATLPGDFIKLGLQGNEQFVGMEGDFSGTRIDLNYYREYALGYAYRYNEKLNVGVRGKMLFGKANISFSDTDISLYTDPGSNNMKLHSNFTVNTSIPMTVVREGGEIKDILFHFDDDDYDPMDFVFNTRNSGFAIDLGVTYQIIEPVTFYASITDLGFINWKKDVYNFSMNGDFEIEGLNLTSSRNRNKDDDPADNLLDSLQGLFKISETQNSYTRGLPTMIYIGGKYEISPGFNFGLLSRSVLYHGRLEQAVSLSANSSMGRRLSASVSYSMMNNKYDNFGMGLSWRGAGLQLYLLTDNLNAVIIPHRSNSINIWAGLNIVTGNVRPVQKLPVI